MTIELDTTNGETLKEETGGGETSSQETEKSVVGKILERREKEAKPAAPAKKGSESDETVSEPVVTAALVKQFPELKTLEGKPMSEIAKSYSELQKLASRATAELSTLKSKKPEEPKAPEQKPAKGSEEKSVEEGILELLEKSELPDPVDDPKAFVRGVLDLVVKGTKMQTDRELGSVREATEAQRKIRELQEQVQTTNTLLSQRLPEDIDPFSVAQAFEEANKEILDQNPGLYSGKPELLASDIALFYYRKRAESEKEGASEEVRQRIRNLKRKIEAAPDREDNGTHKKKAEVTHGSDGPKVAQAIINRHTPAKPA